jgi:lysozyme
MQLSANGLSLLKKSEGFRSHSYLDVAGIPTIGYGHRILPGEAFANGITEDGAGSLLSHDVIEAEFAVKRLVRVELAQCQFDALVDFVYNLGPRRLEASTLLRDLNLGRYGAAAEQLLLWDHAGAKENAGLKARREAEYLLWHSADSGRQTAA